VIHDEAQVSTFFPKVKLIFISAEHTPWPSVHGYRMCRKQYEEALARGEKPRKITFSCVEGGNHFMHYECPDVLLAHVTKGMKA
jgi:alpha/beta superfamily hydrolase